MDNNQQNIYQQMQPMQPMQPMMEAKTTSGKNCSAKIPIIVATVLLVATIVFAVLAFKKSPVKMKAICEECDRTTTCTLYKYEELYYGEMEDMETFWLCERCAKEYEEEFNEEVGYYTSDDFKITFGVVKQ